MSTRILFEMGKPLKGDIYVRIIPVNVGEIPPNDFGGDLVWRISLTDYELTNEDRHQIQLQKLTFSHNGTQVN